MRAHRRRTQRGFGLLEAIVAMTLFSLTGVVLFGWINLSLATLSGAEERLQSSQREETALAALRTLNLFVYDEGYLDLAPDWRLRWEAEPLTPRQTTMPLPGGSRGGHEVQLFLLRAWVEPEGLPPPNTEAHLNTMRLMYQ